MAAPAAKIVIPRWIQLVGLPLVLILLWVIAGAVRHVVFLFLVALLIALLLSPLVRVIATLRVPRGFAVALVYLIFDVEVALFYPWAVAFGSAAEPGHDTFALRQTALVDMLFFFGVLLVGFAYLWRFGYLDWVRSAATTSIRADYRPGFDLSREARVDRPI